jgi:hypothetical protein
MNIADFAADRASPDTELSMPSFYGNIPWPLRYVSFDSKLHHTDLSSCVNRVAALNMQTGANMRSLRCVT